MCFHMCYHHILLKDRVVLSFVITFLFFYLYVVFVYSNYDFCIFQTSSYYLSYLT